MPNFDQITQLFNDIIECPAYNYPEKLSNKTILKCTKWNITKSSSPIEIRSVIVKHSGQTKLKKQKPVLVWGILLGGIGHTVT